MKTGTAELPLHYGHAPPWLFKRMVKLSKIITEIIVNEYGQREFLKRIADPFWFQAFGCVLGFDWHSSGLTTTVTGALKEAKMDELGISILGGKGKKARETPTEIEEISDKFGFSTKKMEELKKSSRLVAKIDSAAVQDGYQLYHHAFILTERGEWAVIQQGMNPENKYARRYHWISTNITDFLNDPHIAICGDKKSKVLNLATIESEKNRRITLDIVKDSPKKLLMPKNHWIDKRIYKRLEDLHEFQPKNYEELLLFKGIGPKTIRALALTTELIFNAKVSRKDPVKYSFTHGGKDGTPYPVNRNVYDKSIEILKDAIENAKLGNKEKIYALKRLNEFYKL